MILICILTMRTTQLRSHCLAQLNTQGKAQRNKWPLSAGANDQPGAPARQVPADPGETENPAAGPGVVGILRVTPLLHPLLNSLILGN